MEYDVNILDVGDADAIVINYRNDNRWVTAVIDAGNVGDGVKVKTYIKHQVAYHYFIDYAICTHPDKDHKGGFFDLFEDKAVTINNFLALDPVDFVSKDNRRFSYSSGELEKNAGKIFNHPQDNTKNLIAIAKRKSNYIGRFSIGDKISEMPLFILGPDKRFYEDAAYEMALNFAELKDEADVELYSEDEIPTEDEAKGVLDTIKEDSPTNKASLICLFKPDNKTKFLLTGDACSKSIHNVIDKFGDDVTQCILKVPHHGSKHNLTTEVIDLIKPVSAVISCKGTKKHPSSSVTYWLSKYCNVYSTSKSNDLIYSSRSSIIPAVPLKKKIDE